MEDATTALLGARDFLLAHRTDYASAKAGFRWPAPERFNFALDWFDVVARERDREALRIVGPAPTVSRTYADLAAASNRLANSLRAAGLRRGDTALLMLGNVEPLWVAMLAMMKLGAVMIPATTLLSADDLRDRLGRGGVKLVIAGAEHVPLFETVGYRGARMSVGGRAPGWLALEDAAAASEVFDPQGETRARDRKSVV